MFMWNIHGVQMHKVHVDQTTYFHCILTLYYVLCRFCVIDKVNIGSYCLA